VAPFAWSWSPEAAAAAVLAGCYLPVLRGGIADRQRAFSFAAGCLLLAAALVTPLDTLARDYLVWAHLLQNVVLAEWAPFLLVLGLPAVAAAHVADRAVPRRLTHPAVALPLWLGTYALWHVPLLYDAALRRPGWLLPLEHLTYLLVGCLLWWPVLRPRSRLAGAGTRALYVFAAFVLSAPLGVLLALLPEPIYEAYADAPQRVFGLSRLADQQLGGVTMAGEQSVLFFAVFTVWFFRFLEAEDRHDR
jgi:putative membrane protein